MAEKERFVKHNFLPVLIALTDNSQGIPLEIRIKESSPLQ